MGLPRYSWSLLFTPRHEVVVYTTALCAWTSGETFGSLVRAMVPFVFAVLCHGMASSSTTNIKVRIHPIYLQHIQPPLIEYSKPF